MLLFAELGGVPIKLKIFDVGGFLRIGVIGGIKNIWLLAVEVEIEGEDWVIVVSLCECNSSVTDESNKWISSLPSVNNSFGLFSEFKLFLEFSSASWRFQLKRENVKSSLMQAIWASSDPLFPLTQAVFETSNWAQTGSSKTPPWYSVSDESFSLKVSQM